MLALHLAMHIILSKHPQLEFRLLGIVDDINQLGQVCDNIIIFFKMKMVFRQLFGTDLNMHKSSLLALKIHTVIDPAPVLESLYVQLPQL